MSSSRNVEDLYVVIGAGDQKFGVPVEFVREMVPMPQVVKVPNAPDHVRGVINLRGKVLPLVDLRVRLGMLSCADESQSMIQMLEEREEDHRQWLNELETSLSEGREFGLARDPHQCAFGRWYDAYDSHSGLAQCLAMDSVLIKFQDPHNRIHAVADQALDLAARGKMEGARALIERTRDTTLSEMVELFAEGKELIAQTRRELALVLADNGRAAAISVDLAESVEMVTRVEGQDLCGVAHLGLDRGLVTGFGRRRKDDSLIMLLDVSEFLDLPRVMAE
jgi:chemotaxis signal transduction protein